MSESRKLAWPFAAVCGVAAIAAIAFWAGGSAGAANSSAAGGVPAGPVRPMDQTIPTVRPTHAELHYVAVAPCRVADTRSGGGALAIGVARSFYVSGTTGFPTQGGTSGGCKVPTYAVAFAANVTSVASTGSGYLKGGAAGSPSSTTFLAYSRGVTNTSTPTLPLRTGTARQLTLKAYQGATQVLIDVTGYYVEQIEATINTDGIDSDGLPGPIQNGSTAVLSVTALDPGYAEVTFDRDIYGCTVSASPYDDRGNPYYFASASPGPGHNKVTVHSFWYSQDDHVFRDTDWLVSLVVTC